MMASTTPASLDQTDYAAIHADIVALLEAARHATARSVNAAMTATYWSVGRRTIEIEQGAQERAAYGMALIERLSVDLSAKFVRGFSRQNLWQIRAYHLGWPAQKISQTLLAKSHSLRILQTAFGTVPNAEYQMVLPDEKLLAKKLDKTRRELDARRLGSTADAEGMV